MATAGDRIDKFTLVRQLGAGGMGATWEAVRQVGRDFEQRVAIKLAEPDLLRTSDGLASFRREAALAASLRHPNIAAVFDVDEKAGYIVCELVDGADLRGVLRSVPGARLEPSVVVHVVAQIARGLNHAHRRILRGRPSPVIHRDMSPGNVVVDYDGNVKIVDFGIAKVLATGAEIAESVKGKLSYMAPEQAMGGRMDGRVDQYALGVIAYECLSSVRPNDRAHEGETLACILEGKHVPLQERVSGVPAGLCRVVERMLALRPTDRYENMEGVLDALAEFTPKLTVNRSLVPLVMAAHQPHTILSENGRFVSRPVEADPLWRASERNLADAAARSLRVGSTAPGGSSAPRRPMVPALAVTLGNTQAAQQVSEAAQLSAARSAPPPLPVPVPVPVPALPIPGPALPRRPTKRPRSGRWLWKSMTVLGVLLLAFVVGVALFPQILKVAAQLWPGIERFGLADNFAEQAQLVAKQLVRPAPVLPAAPVHNTGQAARAQVPDAAEPAPMAAEQQAKPVEPAALTRVRVYVLPTGKVWLDEQLAGDAAPELELSLTPGMHVIAAGNEQGPILRRNVQISAEKLKVVEFDLAAPP